MNAGAFALLERWRLEISNVYRAINFTKEISRLRADAGLEIFLCAVRKREQWLIVVADREGPES